jgi:hypothetical protein
MFVYGTAHYIAAQNVFAPESSATFRLSCARLRKRGLRIVERVSIQVEPTENAANYLRTKKEKLGHLLDS